MTARGTPDLAPSGACLAGSAPAARRLELAALLARAALRLHARAALPPQHGPTGPPSGETSRDPGQTPLDLRAEKSDLRATAVKVSELELKQKEKQAMAPAAPQKSS